MFNQITEKIRESETFLITAHMNLEGDALGSELAMHRALRKLNKKVVICNNDVTPAIYKFLPNINVIKNELNKEQFDVALVLDCSDPFRTGKIKDYLSRAKCIINIDHHISNNYFGDLNWVDPKASSACQILYYLCKHLEVIDKQVALCLYTGIFTDSGGFTYACVNAETHKVIADLMQYPLKAHKIYEQLYSSCQPQDLDFMGKIMSSLKLNANKTVCWTMIELWEDKHYDLTEIIFNFMRLLKGVEVFILFKQIADGKIRVNFRSRSKVDVNRFAKFFGGGGHKRASGTTINGTLEGVERKVMSFVKRYTNGIKNRKSEIRISKSETK